jgi:hypothetical protein
LNIKARPQQEFVVCGFTEGKGSRKHFGALLLGAYRNGKLLYFGHSGTGFSEKGLAEAIFACFGCTIWPAWIVAATVIAASTVNKVLILFVFVLGRNGFDVTAP